MKKTIPLLFLGALSAAGIAFGENTTMKEAGAPETTDEKIAQMKSAAPLIIKNDYRSPCNGEHPLRKSTTLIVLHTTEAQAKISLEKLCERGEAHYCVAEDGTVYRIVDRDRVAYHAGQSMWDGKEDCDEFSIGIYVVGYQNKSVMPQQVVALKELIDQLKTMYRLEDAQVLSHAHIAYGAPNMWCKNKHRGRTRCGVQFAMSNVRSMLGLKAGPESDPDVKANRLVEGDRELPRTLYKETKVVDEGKPIEATK